MKLNYSLMYTALKSAQNEMNETLLKLVERLAMNQNITYPITTPIPDSTTMPMVKPLAQPVPIAEPKPMAMAEPKPMAMAEPKPMAMAEPMAMPMHDYTEDFNRLNSTIEFVSQKQNSQFQALISELKDVNQSLSNLMNVLILQTQNSVNTSTTIPSLQPLAQSSDLNNVHQSTRVEQGTPGQVKEIQVTFNDEEQAGELDGDMSVEQAEQEEQEDEVDLGEEDEIDLGEEEGLEVEEWTYKGRTFFKDSENTVYKNEGGEVGDAIGVYDPVKNLVKSVPPK
jgi:hypothetical protein